MRMLNANIFKYIIEKIGGLVNKRTSVYYYSIYNRIGYNMEIMQQTANRVFNQVMDLLFCCRLSSRVSCHMLARTLIALVVG